MIRKHKSTSTIGFLDLIQNGWLGFIMLFIIAFLMIKPMEIKPDIVKKAEIIITITWDSKSNDDVDSWLQAPNGEIIYFKNKTTTVAHLDRDDLGWSTDEIQHRDGIKEIIYINQEIITIRGIVEGEWVLNVHMYSKRYEKPANIVATIDKLNPYSRVLTKPITLTKRGEEKTVIRFFLTKEGEIGALNDTPKKLVKQEVQNQSNLEGGGY